MTWVRFRGRTQRQKRKETLQSCLLTSTYMAWHVYSTHTYITCLRNTNGQIIIFWKIVFTANVMLWTFFLQSIYNVKKIILWRPLFLFNSATWIKTNVHFYSEKQSSYREMENQYGKGSVVYLILANQQLQRGLELRPACAPHPLSL